jgi:hypothetical protein
MIISKSKNFVYIHLDKCGGTSIESALYPFLNNDDIKIGTLKYNEDTDERFKQHNLTKHSNAKTIIDYLKNDWNTMYKFTTVRDPQDLMISLYFYVKKHFDPLILDDPYFIDYKKCLENNTGIDGFIEETIKSNPYSVQSFTSRLDNAVDIFDINNINIYWNLILKKLNISENIVLPKLNQTKKDETINLKPNTIDLIYDKFLIDYKTIPKITGCSWK